MNTLTLSNADKLRFAEVEDRITREFGDGDTMDFLEYLKQQEETKLTHPLKINFKKLSPTAITPTKAHTTDAGFDLYADENVNLKYGDTLTIKTNIAIELPEGHVADVRPRSGLTLNTGLRVHYGTVDAGYRDGIGIICENGNHAAMTVDVMNQLMYEITGDMSHANKIDEYDGIVEVRRGQKIAQLVILPIPKIELQEVTELSDSDRGVNGFGSTGV